MAKNDTKKLTDFDVDYMLGRSWLVGIDEAGRGCLAGPVCAGAVCVSANFYKSSKYIDYLSGLNDSKKLSENTREILFKKLEELKSIGIIDFEAGFASVEEIEKYNILVATQMAMARACEAINERQNLRLRSMGSVATLFGESALDVSLAEVLIDGKPMKKFPYVHHAIVKGDASSLAIAAASIVAKVSRDRLMATLALEYPRYNFEVHKGYGTAAHLQALMLYGTTKIHRPSFLKKMRADTVEDTQGSLF